MRPVRVERLSARQMQARLRQLEARLQREVSSARRHVYFSAPARLWIAVESEGGGVARLSFYRDCPCGG